MKNRYVIPLLGCCFEFYDFMLYIHMALIISNKFFPNENTPLINMAVVAIGFASRPLGGLFFSHFSDKFDRSIILQVTAFIMGLCSIMIAFLPTYTSIGVVATVLVLSLRLLQGFSAGGEIPTAISYLIENASEERKGFIGSIVYFSFTIGSLVAYGLSALVIVNFQNEFINQYGWRIPFIFGGVLFIFSFYLRSKIRKNNDYYKNRSSKAPLIELFKSYKTNIFYGLLIFSLPSLITASYFVLMPNLVTARIGVTKEYSSIINLCFLFTLPTLAMVIGKISIKINERKLYFSGALLLAITTILFLNVFAVNSIFSLIMMYICVTVSASFIFGTIYIIIYRLFPSNVRSSGIAIVTNLGTLSSGGLAPIMIHNIINKFYGINAVLIITLVYILITLPLLYYKLGVNKNENSLLAAKS